jgi:hypothetical protein
MKAGRSLPASFDRPPRRAPQEIHLQKSCKQKLNEKSCKKKLKEKGRRRAGLKHTGD